MQSVCQEKHYARQKFGNKVHLTQQSAFFKYTRSIAKAFAEIYFSIKGGLSKVFFLLKLMQNLIDNYENIHKCI